MKTPKVSILIPTYNYGRFLAAAIESVLEQEFQDYELLIVDDCSNDNTAEIMRRYASSDPRICCRINNCNLGMVQNWNYCMSLAKGEYIKFLFGDDKFAGRQALGTFVSMLESNPKVVMAVSARRILNEDSKWVDTWDDLGKSGLHEGNATISRCLIRGQNLIGEPSAVLFRKAHAQRGFNLDFRQLVDLEMWFYLLEQGDLAYTRKSLCYFRKHSKQQSFVNNVNKVGQVEGFVLLDRLLPRAGGKFARLGAGASVWDRLGLVYCLRQYPQTPKVLELQQNYMNGISKVDVFFYWLGKRYESLIRSIRKRMFRWGIISLFSRG